MLSTDTQEYVYVRKTGACTSRQMCRCTRMITAVRQHVIAFGYRSQSDKALVCDYQSDNCIGMWFSTLKFFFSSIPSRTFAIKCMSCVALLYTHVGYYVSCERLGGYNSPYTVAANTRCRLLFCDIRIMCLET